VHAAIVEGAHVFVASEFGEIATAAVVGGVGVPAARMVVFLECFAAHAAIVEGTHVFVAFEFGEIATAAVVGVGVPAARRVVFRECFALHAAIVEGTHALVVAFVLGEILEFGEIDALGEVSSTIAVGSCDVHPIRGVMGPVPIVWIRATAIVVAVAVAPISFRTSIVLTRNDLAAHRRFGGPACGTLGAVTVTVVVSILLETGVVVAVVQRQEGRELPFEVGDRRIEIQCCCLGLLHHHGHFLFWSLR